MDRTPDDITALVESELARFRFNDVKEAFEKTLTAPERQEREWEYGPGGTSFECWVVARVSHEWGIAYCQFGYGPSSPWGVVNLHDQTYFGPDSCWYARLEDAFIAAVPWKGPLPDDYEVE